MKFIFKGKKLLLTLVMYSCVIFIIPTIILLGKLYFSDIVNLQEAITNTSINNIRYISNVIEKKLTELDTIAIKISQGNKTSKFYMSGGLAQEMDGIAEIAKYKEMNGFVDDVLVYFKNDDYIYSSEGRSSFDTMFNLVYQYPANVRYEIINNLKNIEEPLIVKNQQVLVRGIDKNNITTYLYPIKNEYEKKNLTVAFIVSEQSLIGEIKNNYDPNLGDIFIIDEENHVLASTGSSVIERNEVSPKFFSNLKYNEVSIVKHNNENYFLTSTFLSNTDIRIVLVAKEAELFSEVASSRVSLLVLIFVLLILGLILIFVMVSKSYNSILKIKNKMNLHSTDISNSGSELDQIISWIDNVIEQKEKIEDEYQSRHQVVKNQILEMLLKGDINNIGNLNSLVDSNDLDFIEGLFCVIVITPADPNHKLNEDWDAHALEQIESTYSLELYSDNSFAIIAIGQTEDDVKNTESCIIDTVQRLYPEHYMKIGIGKIYSELSFLNNSFFEAQISLDHMNKNNNLLRYEDIIFEKEGTAYWNLNEEQAKFIQCVKYGNLEGAKLNLDIMLDTIATNETSYIYRNLAYLDIINMLIKVCKNNNILINQETIAQLSNIGNFDQIQEKLEAVLEKSLSIRKNNQEEQSNKIFNSILLYINENYYNSDISLESVADHFGLTPHFLSRFIKENLDVSFTDLLVKLRMDKFKHLVVETDKPIKELITAVGYIDTSSFVRKFKKMEGITPGAYRRMIKNG